jgi:hypothetical protein
MRQGPSGLQRADLKPGHFYYWGGCIHEVDNKGLAHPRPDLGPGDKFTHRYYHP